MGTCGRKEKVSLLDSRIELLNKSTIQVPPAIQVFRTVGAILALVRDKMIENKDSVELSEYSFNVCEVLKTVIHGKTADNLSESVRVALENFGRVIREIEQTLRRGAGTPLIEYDKGKIEGCKLEIQEILNALNAPRSLLDENLTVNERAPLLAPVDPHSHDTATTSASEACGRLIRREFNPHELSPLVEVIFASDDAGDMIHRLPMDDAQAFIDVIDEALDRPEFSPWTRKKCFKSLYRACGRHALLPSALKIPIFYDRTGVALYRGGYADVWKGEHCGRDVAVKVIRMYSNSDLQKVIGRFCKEVMTWKTLRHPNVLPLIGIIMSENQFAMISDWMVNGNINDFVKAHPDANRLELVRDVARGLIYIHSQGMVHGDLKGANIVIDQTGRARLADFGLLTIISDPANLLASSSYIQGGTVRWMSPELIAPQDFGLKNSRPTKSSDCYSLGMVIYETISGNIPFHEHTDLTVFVKVLRGERPSRGARLTKSLWEMLERCWAFQPNDRPSVEDVLQRLETSLDSSEPLSPTVDEGVGTDSDSEDTSDYSPPAHFNGLPDYEGESYSRGPSFSSCSHTHGHPSSPPAEDPGLLGFDSTHSSTARPLPGKLTSPSRKASHPPSSVVSDVSPESTAHPAPIPDPPPPVQNLSFGSYGTGFPDDVAIIGGRANVISGSGSSHSPNSTSRLSESLQSMSMGISGVAGTVTSPNMSPVVSDARVRNVHGSANTNIDKVMHDLGLEYYNPTHPHQYSKYMNGTNGAVGHGNGGMLPPTPAHLDMGQMYKDPRSQQQYMTDSHLGYHQQDYRYHRVPAVLVHGPGCHEEIWMKFIHQLTTPDGQSHHNGYQPQMGHHG